MLLNYAFGMAFMILVPLFTTRETKLATAHAFYIITSDRFLYT